MSDDRRLRDLEAAVRELREVYHPVSATRLEQLWTSVRETLDAFSEKLVQGELDRRGHSDTLAKLLAQHRQIETILATHAVEIALQRQQVNDLIEYVAEHGAD